MGQIFLLENMGFIIGYKKCVLEPTQQIEFLGFTVYCISSESLQKSATPLLLRELAVVTALTDVVLM